MIQPNQLITLNNDILEIFSSEIGKLVINHKLWHLTKQSSDETKQSQLTNPQSIMKTEIKYKPENSYNNILTNDEQIDNIWKENNYNNEIDFISDVVFIDLRKQASENLKSFGILDKCDFLLYELNGYCHTYKEDAVTYWNMLSKPILLPRLFAYMPNLQTIDLHNIDFDYFGYELFKGCHQLKIIKLIDCHISMYNPICEPFEDDENIDNLFIKHKPSHIIKICQDQINNYHWMGMFEDCENIEEIDLTSSTIWEYSENPCCGLFESQPHLKRVILKNTSITNMDYMFKDCENLEYVDMSGAEVFAVIDTGKGYDYTVWMTESFSGCVKLKTVILDGFKVEITHNGYYDEEIVELDIHRVFQNCKSLEEIDLSKIEIINECPDELYDDYKAKFDNMFKGCDNLKTIIPHPLIDYGTFP